MTLQVPSCDGHRGGLGWLYFRLICHRWMHVVLLGSSTDLVLITWAEAPLLWSPNLCICLAPVCWEMMGTSTLQKGLCSHHQKVLETVTKTGSINTGQFH